MNTISPTNLFTPTNLTVVILNNKFQKVLCGNVEIVNGIITNKFRFVAGIPATNPNTNRDQQMDLVPIPNPCLLWLLRMETTKLVIQ